MHLGKILCMLMHMYHIMIMGYILLKSQENLHFDMTNNTVVHE